MSDIKPFFQSEVWFSGWGDGHKAGPWIRLSLTDSDALEPFRGLTERKGKQAGQRFMCVLVEIGDDEQPRPHLDAKSLHMKEMVDKADFADTSKPNELAQKMHRDGWFRSPHLWKKMEEHGIYSQADHKKWIEAQPCQFSAIRELHQGPCMGDICAHHTPSAALPAAGKGSDKPRKPPHWYTVPACVAHHQWCHSSTGATREDKQKLVELGIALTAGQMKVMVKAHLGIQSLREITQEMLDKFEADIGL